MLREKEILLWFAGFVGLLSQSPGAFGKEAGGTYGYQNDWEALL